MPLTHTHRQYQRFADCTDIADMLMSANDHIKENQQTLNETSTAILSVWAMLADPING
jgi:hypothetical protein